VLKDITYPLPHYILLTEFDSSTSFSPRHSSSTPMDLSIKADPSSPAVSPTTIGNDPPKHNPYQRIASRRAIACVTCAKAKTKCDKGVGWQSLGKCSSANGYSFHRALGASPRESNATLDLLDALPITAFEQASRSHSPLSSANTQAIKCHH
jgi:hypothetical protein